MGCGFSSLERDNRPNKNGNGYGGFLPWDPDTPLVSQKQLDKEKRWERDGFPDISNIPRVIAGIALSPVQRAEIAEERANSQAAGGGGSGGGYGMNGQSGSHGGGHGGAGHGGSYGAAGYGGGGGAAASSHYRSTRGGKSGSGSRSSQYGSARSSRYGY